MKNFLKYGILFLIILSLGVFSFLFFERLLPENMNFYRGESIRIDEIYTKDNVDVYYSGVIIENADPKTFEVINKTYAKDEKNIFFLGKAVDYLDAKTFELLDTDINVVRDKNGWYRNLSLFIPKTCGEEPLNKNIRYGQYGYRDLKNGEFTFSFYEKYRYTDQIEMVSDAYYKVEGKAIYHEECQLAGADVNAFEFVQNGFAKTKKNVYFKGNRIDGLDPSTLKVISEDYVADAKGIYFLSADMIHVEKISFQMPEKFQILGGGYSTDGEFLMYGNSKIGLYSETFHILSEKARTAEDEKLYYGSGVLVSKKIQGWKLVTEEPFNEDGSIKPLRFEGKKSIQGWYEYDYEYEEKKGWVFHVVHSDISLFPEDITGLHEDGSEITPSVKIVTTLSNDQEDMLKKASKERPATIRVTSFTKYPHSRPEVEIDLEKISL
ncbi:MAG: DKNYY domain-containing protein [Candidatus Moraniibacteriota bacterium]|nr:MAG: DKNYY domain-containing protein [Candidatus Moranbacteria bacterium]